MPQVLDIVLDIPDARGSTQLTYAELSKYVRAHIQDLPGDIEVTSFVPGTLESDPAQRTSRIPVRVHYLTAEQQKERAVKKMLDKPVPMEFVSAISCEPQETLMARAYDDAAGFIARTLGTPADGLRIKGIKGNITQADTLEFIFTYQYDPGEVQ